MVYAYEEGSGPMSAFIEGESEIESSAQGERHEEREEFWEELHEIAANSTLALVLLHVLGVLFAGRAHGENLVIPMISGKKYVGPPGSNDKSK
jgi:cytochrome b